MSANAILTIIGTTLMYSTPLLFAALGGVISERSGVVNIGLEGMMMFGSFIGATVGYFTASPWIGLACGGLAGMALSYLHALASIKFRANQTVSGIAMNFIGLGFSLFIARLVFDGAVMTKPVPNKIPKILTGELSPGLAAVNFDVLAIVALAATALMWVFLYRTKWGLRVRAVGEHPAAADTLGIRVYGIRYACVLASGFLAGIGGATFSLSVVSYFSPVAFPGLGFIALAAVIFGRWTPHGTYGACLLFGLALALVVQLGGGKTPIPSQLIAMLPYVLTLVLLVLFGRKSRAPKADGVPYEKGSR